MVHKASWPMRSVCHMLQSKVVRKKIHQVPHPTVLPPHRQPVLSRKQFYPQHEQHQIRATTFNKEEHQSEISKISKHSNLPPTIGLKIGESDVSMNLPCQGASLVPSRSMVPRSFKATSHFPSWTQACRLRMAGWWEAGGNELGKQGQYDEVYIYLCANLYAAFMYTCTTKKYVDPII